jgi:hypothetical protein
MKLAEDPREQPRLHDAKVDGRFTARSSRPKLCLAGVAALSACLRLVLVMRGGQFFWPDEEEFWRTWVVLRLATEKNPGKMVDYILGHIKNWLYIVLAGPFAVVQAIYMKLRHVPAIDSTTVPQYLWVSAGAMTVFSVACIVLAYLIALRSGADEWEAVAAATLMAAANTLFYYSRHLLPYDAAMALALFAFLIGLKRKASLARSFNVGLVASLAFSTYNGYWYLALVVFAAHLLYASRNLRDFFVRTILSGAAFVLPTCVMTALTAYRHLPLFVNGMWNYAATIFQGNFSEGWKLPFLYFWDAEHFTAIAWAALMVIGVVYLVRRESFANAVATRHRGLLFLACALAIYLLLATASALHIFVVYARTARQALPFLCLGAAFGLRRIPRYMAIAIVVVVVIQAAWNFSVPLHQRFPIDVERLAESYMPARQMGSGFVPTGIYFDSTCKQLSSAPVGPQFVLMNTCPVWPSFWPTTPAEFVPFPTNPADHRLERETLFAFPHPLSWRPNQDDGFTPEQRRTLRNVDLRMRLIQVR